MKNLIIIIVILISLYINSNAQFWYNIGSAGGYGINTTSDTTYSTLITQSDFSIGKQIGDDFEIFGSLSYINFAQFTERNFFNPQIGINYNYELIEDDLLLNLSLNTDFRTGSAQYNYFNYIQPVFGLNLNYSIDETSGFGINSSLRYKNYTQMNDFNFVDNLNSFNIRKSFESKTTLSLALSLNNRTYIQNYEEVPIDNFTFILQNKHNGKGKMNKNNSNNLDTIYNEDSTISTIYRSVGAKTVSQFKYAINIAQNIFENTGISANIQQSFIISDNKATDYSSAYDFATDDDLFDDPFAYNLSRFMGKITHLLPEDIKLQLSYSYNIKDYSFLANEFNSNIMRKDKVNSFGINLEKAFTFDNFAIDNLSLIFDYSIINNNSNTSDFNYNYSFIMLGASISF